jgi:hypothetical protein
LVIRQAGSSAPEPVAQFAELRGSQPLVLDHDQTDLAVIRGENADIIAIRWELWERLDGDSKNELADRVKRGMVLYLGGGLKSGGSYSLKPWLDAPLVATALDNVRGYSFTSHRLVPKPLEGEHVDVEIPSALAATVGPPSEPLVVTRPSDGGQRALIFAIPSGAGFVICDWTAHTAPSHEESPILSRLIDREQRLRNIGPLIAVDFASGRNFKDPGFYNLTLDDRPANYDFLRLAQLRRCLLHMREIADGFHLDCAWTPDQSRPLRSYVSTLKEFGAGFVWHGLLSHIDHTKIADPGADLQRGRERIRAISGRYGVEIQPIMIFPFERRNDAAIRCLIEGKFEAMVEYAEANAEGETHLPAHLRYSTPLRRSVAAGFPVLRRYPRRVMDFDRMLGLAALGLPIIANAHPNHLGIARLRSSVTKGSIEYFDDVLHFATSKRMRPATLMQLAAEMKEWPQPFAEHNAAVCHGRT